MKVDPRYRNQPNRDVENERFIVPDGGGQIPSRYDFNNSEAQHLDQNDSEPFFTEILDLSTARDIIANPLIIERQGRGFVFFGIAQSNGVPSPVEAVDTAIFVEARVGRNTDGAIQQSRRGWPGKHGRGYRGDFKKLFLGWPAQNAKYARLVIFHFDEQAYADGGTAT